MTKPKFIAQVGNVYFLGRIGMSLRWATSDITHEELPAEIKHLLRRLDRLEARQARSRGDGESSGKSAAASKDAEA